MNLYILVFCLLLTSCHSVWKKMSYDRGKVIRLEVLDSLITVNTGDEFFHLNVRLTNYSDSAFILYGFKAIQPAGSEVSFYKNGTYIPTHFIIVGNKLGEPDIVTAEEPSSNPSMELDSTSFVGSLVSVIANEMQKNRLVINSNSTWLGKMKVLIATKRLKNFRSYEETENIKILGRHDLFLLYVSGVNVTNIISEEHIKKDEKENGAILFQGYAQSNTVKLIVKD